MSKNITTKKITSIGGSALLEGIMMRGPKKTSLAVRKENGSIHKQDVEFSPILSKNKFFKIPIIRGIIGFVDSMRLSYKCLMISADVAMEDAKTPEEPSKFEKWLTDKVGDKLTNIIMVIASVLGIALALFLFFFVPSQLFKLITSIFPGWDTESWQYSMFRSVFEGVVKIALFVGYILLTSLMPDMKRTFQYHGAEHKTIFCYENDLELTVENVKKQSRFHPRCGTSFLIIMLIVGIIIGFFIRIDNVFIRVPIRILMLPLIMGIGYELIKICGRYDNPFTRIISAPGMWAQRITTREPDEKMIEIAIEAMKAVIPENGEDLICCKKPKK
ncbi:MAG: DUF1385 domain-containing protein [Clostridia bacterium]|nr:DUF1385 domain-containing protein [Clostridia bacterium]